MCRQKIFANVCIFFLFSASSCAHAAVTESNTIEILSPNKKTVVKEGMPIMIDVRIPKQVAAKIHELNRLIRSNQRHPLEHECPIEVHFLRKKHGGLYEAKENACPLLLYGQETIEQLRGNRLQIRTVLSFRPEDVQIEEPYTMYLPPDTYVLRVALGKEWQALFPDVKSVVGTVPFSVVEHPKKPPAYVLKPLQKRTYTAGDTMRLEWSTFGIPPTWNVSFTLYKRVDGTLKEDLYLCNIAEVKVPHTQMKRIGSQSHTYTFRIPKIGDSVHGKTDILHCAEFGDTTAQYLIRSHMGPSCSPSPTCPYARISDMTPVFTIKP